MGHPGKEAPDCVRHRDTRRTLWWKSNTQNPTETIPGANSSQQGLEWLRPSLGRTSWAGNHPPPSHQGPRGPGARCENPALSLGCLAPTCRLLPRSPLLNTDPTRRGSGQQPAVPTTPSGPRVPHAHTSPLSLRCGPMAKAVTGLTEKLISFPSG